MPKISLGVDLSWPQKGDKLFVSGNDPENDALLNRGERTLDQYAVGYKLAADTLVDRVIETGLMHDFLVLPIAFLYRQYFELRFKEIIDSAYRLAVMGFIPSPEPIFWKQWMSKAKKRLCDSSLIYPANSHNLQALWTEEVRPLTKVVFPTTAGSDLDAVETCIREFQEADPKGDGFRYPATTQGLKTLQGLSRLNLREFKETVQRINGLLEGISEGLVVYRQTQSEMNEDCHP